MKKILFILILSLYSYSIEIKQMPIKFSQERIDLSKKYIKDHYHLNVKNIEIIPKIIVVHHTGNNSLIKSFNRFNPEILLSDRKYILKASKLNVSTHFLVDRDGAIYSLMPENYFARHTIGLNYSSIAIENIGGEFKKNNLTKEQLESNIELINYLKNKYSTIDYLIGHHEYQNFKNHALYLEKDKNYKTIKHDPGEVFMKELRKEITLKY